MAGNKPGPDASVVTQQIIEFCMEGMAFREHKFALKRKLSLILFGPKLKENGEVEDENVPSRLMAQESYERIRKKARELLHERSIIIRKEARSDSVGLYEAIVRDPCASSKDRMTAQTNLDKIHGITLPDPTPDINLGFIPVDQLELSQEEKIKLLKALTKKENASNS